MTEFLNLDDAIDAVRRMTGQERFSRENLGRELVARTVGTIAAAGLKCDIEGSPKAITAAGLRHGEEIAGAKVQIGRPAECSELALVFVIRPGVASGAGQEGAGPA